MGACKEGVWVEVECGKVCGRCPRTGRRVRKYVRKVCDVGKGMWVCVRKVQDDGGKGRGVGVCEEGYDEGGDGRGMGVCEEGLCIHRK